MGCGHPCMACQALCRMPTFCFISSQRSLSCLPVPAVLHTLLLKLCSMQYWTWDCTCDHAAMSSCVQTGAMHSMSHASTSVGVRRRSWITSILAAEMVPFELWHSFSSVQTEDMHMRMIHARAT